MNTPRKIALAGDWSGMPDLEAALRGTEGLAADLVDASLATPEDLVRRGAFDLLLFHLGTHSAEAARQLRALFAHSMRPRIFAVVDAAGFEAWSRFAQAVDDFCVLDSQSIPEIALRVRRLALAPRPIAPDMRTATPALRLGDIWLVEATRYLIGTSGGIVRLSFAQARFLSLLCGAAGEFVEAEVLAGKLGYEDWTPADRSIEVLVRRLRKKMAALTPQPVVENTGRTEYRLAAIPQRCLLPAEFVRHALAQTPETGFSRLRVEAAVLPSTNSVRRMFVSAPWMAQAA
ncbi:MAG: helix-turn-helix domain-containing protein [Burkholderiaceae bacterium]